MSFFLIIAVLFILAFAVLFGLAFLVNGITAKNQDKLTRGRQQLTDKFGDGDYNVDLPDLRCFGVSWDQRLVIIGGPAEIAKDTNFNDPPAYHLDPSTIPFADVRSVDVAVDDIEVTNSRSTTSTNRGSQMMGGALGGLALGPAGLLVGGLSGSSTTTGQSISQRKVKSVKLIVRIAERKAPLRTYVFYDAGYGDGYEASSPIVQPALEKAAHYHALLTQIVEEKTPAS